MVQKCQACQPLPGAARGRHCSHSWNGRASVRGFQHGADRLTNRLRNGISRVRVNLGTAGQAAALSAYREMGFSEFILSGYPHREECERVAAEVLPLVAAG